jgi:hypothetical protein
MGYTYEWKLVGLKKSHGPNGIESAVVGTNWKVTGIDENGLSGSFNGATPFELSKIDTNNFVDYNNLTEETVLNWVKSVVSGSGYTNYWKHIDEKIKEAIDAQTYAAVTLMEHDLPWSPISGSTEHPPVPTPYTN